MKKVFKKSEIDELDEDRALIGVFLDHRYNPDKITWLLQARDGFDHHAEDAWHLLIPVKEDGGGYCVDTWVGPEEYGVALAAGFIRSLGIQFEALPCIIFRANEDEHFYLKLGGKSQDQFYDEIGRIADLAKECHRDGPQDPREFRDYVNMQVANHLRRRKLLSAAKSALPALSKLLGGIVDLKELV